MAQEPESREAMLARLRQERAEDNAASLVQSDANRAAWLAQIEAQLARLRTPTEQATAYGAALFDQLAAYFRELLGHEPWAYTAMGKVLRVDRPTKTCRVQIAADALNPAAVPGQRKVSYGFAAPQVGKTYPVHFPTRVTRGGPLAAEPDPEHLPWLKAPGGVTYWLYYEQWDDPFAAGKLWRIPWPLPDGATPNDGELIRDLAVIPGWTGYPGRGSSLGMVGYHVGARTVVWFNEEADHSFKVLYLEDWGFGTPTVSVVTEPVLCVVSDTLETATNAIVVLGQHGNPVDVPSGEMSPPTVSYTSTTFLDDSTDSGATWATVTSYPAQGVNQNDPLSGLPFVPPRFALMTQIFTIGTSQAITKSPGFMTVADTVLGAPDTGVQLFVIHRQVGVTDTWAGEAQNSVTIGAYFPATHTVTDVVTLDRLVNGSLTSDNLITDNAQFCQLDSGEFVAYLTLSPAAPSQTDPDFPLFFKKPMALYRALGPLDNLSVEKIGVTYNEFDSPSDDPDSFRSWDDPISPWLPLAVTADGSSVIAWTVGYDLIDTGDRRVIYSVDYGDTWAALSDDWQSTIDHATPFFRPVYLVPIPADDPRAAPVGG